MTQREFAEPEELNQLVRRFARGDDSALRALLAVEENSLRRHLTARAPADYLRRQGVSDALQQATLGIVRMRGRLENQGHSAFRRLLHVIAERVLFNAIEYERAAKRNALRDVSLGGTSPSTAASPQLADKGTTTPSERAMRREDVATIQECFSQLHENHQRIIHLVDYEGLSYEAAAVELKLPYDTVRKRYLRAMEQLRRLAREAGLTQ